LPSHEVVSPTTTNNNSSQVDIVERSSLYCLESQYPNLTAPLTSSHSLHGKSDDILGLYFIPDPMSKSQSKEFFKKKQRGPNKRNSTTGLSVSIANPAVNIVPPNKGYHMYSSRSSATGLIGSSEDPALAVINPHSSPTIHQTKEKRTKICCLL
ncbi:unnamed protein product, partial [Rotaria magnacalcarata]